MMHIVLKDDKLKEMHITLRLAGA